ncbi:hypothetical protein OK016_01350 [Vibrio chagasii]|nr:hypothetical protein [Vibrio chagasii]
MVDAKQFMEVNGDFVEVVVGGENDGNSVLLAIQVLIAIVVLFEVGFDNSHK